MDIMLKLSELCGRFDVELFTKILSFIFFAYIDVKTFLSLFKIEIDKKTKTKLISIISALKIISVIFIPAPYYIPVNLTIAIVLFKVILKKNIEKCILGEAINATIIIIRKGNYF